MAFAIKKETTDRQLEYIWSKLDNLQEYWRCKQQYASPAYLKPYLFNPKAHQLPLAKRPKRQQNLSHNGLNDKLKISFGKLEPL